MSIDKVFEALEEIGNIDLGDNPYKKFDTNKLKNVYGVEFTTLYNALTELKAIKEAKPSEALKCLESLRKSANTFCQHMPEQCELNKKYADTINQALLKAQELEKIIEEYDLKSCELREALLLYAMYKGEYKGNPLPALKQYKEQEKVLNSIIKHLSFEGSGVEVVKDFINDKEETKYIIKVESKDTGATIHIHLDTEEESKLLKRYLNGK